MSMPCPYTHVSLTAQPPVSQPRQTCIQALSTAASCLSNLRSLLDLSKPKEEFCPIWTEMFLASLVKDLKGSGNRASDKHTNGRAYQTKTNVKLGGVEL
eukprot:1236074-Amphidinium_carterae.1